VVDVLADFPHAKLSADDLLRCLRPLQPRLYSISSSPLEEPNRVQAGALEVLRGMFWLRCLEVLQS